MYQKLFRILNIKYNLFTIITFLYIFTSIVNEKIKNCADFSFGFD